MNIKIPIIAIFILLSIILNSGCIEEEKINERYDIYVGSNIKNGYSTIEEAIDNSKNGDSIFIFNGNYNESILINKSINIIGESNDKTIINYNYIGNQTQEFSIITIFSDNCTIDSININNTYDNKALGIVIKSSNNTIINNSISNTNKGIFIDSNYNNISINNTILFNNISNNNYGLHVTYSDGNNISNNNIENNQLYGIYLQSSDDNIIYKNQYIKNNGYALRIKGSRYNEFYENEISYNNKGLYFCCGARYNRVYKNNFQENIDWHANDALGNEWDNGTIGNYWDDYKEKYPNSEKNNGTWNIPYNITGGSYMDNFPLINPI